MSKNFTVINKGTNGKATMMLTGSISFYNGEYSFSASQFIKDFNELKESNQHIHIDIVNLYGGSITEGIPVYNHIKEAADGNEFKITGKIDGLAASMGSIIAMAIPVDDLEMGNMARIMNHSAKGIGYGTASEVRNAADTIEGYEDDLVNILAERTGLSSKKIKAKWMDGLDHYIKADEAKRLKLVGKTTKSKVIKKSPDNATDPLAVFNFYQDQITNSIENNNNQEPEDMKLIAQFIAAFAVAGIEIDAENATEENFLTEVKNLTNKNTDLNTKLTAAEAKLQTQAEAAVTDFVANAKSKELIQENQVASLTKMATNDMEAAKEFVDSLTPRKSLSQQLNNGVDPKNEDDPKKDFDWYRKNDHKALAKMKSEDLEKYNELKNAHLNKKN